MRARIPATSRPDSLKAMIAAGAMVLIFNLPATPPAAAGMHASERFGWRSTGIYRVTRAQYRAGLFNHDGATVDAMDLHQGCVYSLDEAAECELLLGGLSLRADILAEAVRERAWRADLDATQLFVQGDLGAGWHVMAGRAILRWGTGYAFNPTDVLAPDKELSDPDNEEGRQRGRDLVKVEYFGESSSAAAVVSADVTRGKGFEDPRAAVCLYRNIRSADVSLIAAVTEGQTPLVGVSVSDVIGERLEVHGEASFQKGSFEQYHSVLCDSTRLFSHLPFDDSRRDSERLFNRYLAGLQCTLPANVMWVLEYYHQDHGYSKREWDRLVEYDAYLAEQGTGSAAALARTNMLWSMNVFSPKGAMRDYLMAHVDITVVGRHHLELTVLLNLADGSAVVLPEAHIAAGNRLAFFARGSTLKGGAGTEFGGVFYAGFIEGGIVIRL